jgi:ABC-type glycerol-3-phosphate transport system substrate-binding protein
MKKRLLMLMLATAMVLPLAACGGSAGSDTKQESSDDAADPYTDPYADPYAGGGN